ncbi:hypothetical protein KKG63_03690 [Patescibacteria group bacterium]|nr:hypothetical protein [Patescibacteria group bacterium]
MTYVEFAKALGFPPLLYEKIFELLEDWNNITVVETDLIQEDTIRGCYYWEQLPIRDMCLVDGELSICEKRVDWMSISPSIPYYELGTVAPPPLEILPPLHVGQV